jgi:hypothetical protein
MALYSPELHEQLGEEAWSAERARELIRAIVADADSRYSEERLWPPSDPWDDWGGQANLPPTSLSTGAAGVAWGLSVLARRGHAEPRTDPAAVAVRAHEAWLVAPDTPEQLEPPVSTYASLFMGETGPLLVACVLAPSRDRADALHGRVVANRDNAVDRRSRCRPPALRVPRRRAGTPIVDFV